MSCPLQGFEASGVGDSAKEAWMQNLDSDPSVSGQQAQRFLNRIDNERLIN